MDIISYVKAKKAQKTAEDARAQVIRTSNEVFYGNVMQHKKPKKLITIIDDDGQTELYDVLYPTLKSLGVPFTSALITSRVGNANRINLEQMKEMQDSGFVEFISHSVTHPHLAELTESEIDYELRESKKWISEHGGNPDYFVYPFNSTNELVLSKTREYYKGAFSTTGEINLSPLDSMLIKRVNFDRDETYLKNRIDLLDNQDGWLIFNMHSQYPSHTVEFIEEIVGYALNKGLEFVTVGEAMKHFGNLIDTEEGVVGANGEATGIFSGSGSGGAGGVKFINNDDIFNDTPITHFDSNCLTMTHFQRAMALDRGFPDAGIYQVLRMSSNTFGRAYFLPYDNINFYYRMWDNSDKVWGEWIYCDVGGDIESNEITGDTTPEEMPRKYFSTRISGGTSNGFPADNGVLHTDIRGGGARYFQRFEEANSVNEYKRYYGGSQGWTDWVLITASAPN